MDGNSMYRGGGKMNLLIIDDEIITIKGIKKGINWEALPFEHVFSITSVREAKNLFKTHKIDIMICDIEMPEENGLNLLEWVREQKYETECIFLTCHEKFDFARKALQLKGMDYLLKPIPYQKLQEILSVACEHIYQTRISSRYEAYGKNQLQRMHEKTKQFEKKPNGRLVAEKVKEYIGGHLQEELSAEILGRQAFVSSDYLFHLFKKEEGITLGEYITNARMFYASELLKTSDASISHVAISVGYNNYCYFTRVFKKIFGMTPSQFQREYRKQ